MTPIEKLGFDQKTRATLAPEDFDSFDLARVMAVHKESYIISNGEVEAQAELMGKMMFAAASPVDYPTVGDWVRVSFYDGRSFAVIQEILGRTSLLKRKTPGKKVDFQLIAANIDTALIVQSLNENFNLRRLERYLVMVNESRIAPVVLLSKSDLLDASEIEKRTRQIKTIMPDLEIIAFSNETPSGPERIKKILAPGQTYCLIGSSGVGKTTLLNHLIGKAIYRTRTVGRSASKGRHATTSRQLIPLDSGAIIIDTPGMRELGHFFVDTGIDETFSDIIALSEKCRFRDCSHGAEKGCAVLDAVKNGTLSFERFENFMKMTRESAFNAMSYVEKRQKDKAFSKMCKTVMKQKKNRC